MNQYRPNDRHIAEQAAEWQIALKTGDARTWEAFTNWLLESRRHVRNYLLLVAFEQQLKGIDAERRHDVDNLLAHTATDVVALEPDKAAVPSAPAMRSASRRWTATSGRWRWTAAIAATVVIAVLLVQWLSPSLASPLYKTGTGEQQTLKLADGSVVYLNAQSRLRVGFSAQQRNVQLLGGEALFVVADDPQRPFNVIAGATVVQAIGTQFNVRRMALKTVVSVVEGRVRVETGTGPSALAVSTPQDYLNIFAAGEEARIDGNGRIEKGATADIERRVAWRQRILEFRDDTLATVIAEFNRYNPAPKFKLEGDDLSTRHYTGVFKADDPESLAQLLAQEGDILVERSPAEIVIRRRPR